MESQQELCEVDGAAIVCVEGSEGVLAELFGVPLGEHLQHTNRALQIR